MNCSKKKGRIVNQSALKTILKLYGYKNLILFFTYWYGSILNILCLLNDNCSLLSNQNTNLFLVYAPIAFA